MAGHNKEDDEKILYPLAEVYRHTLLRGAGLGSFAAVLIASPYLLFKRAKGVQFFLRLGKASSFGIGLGLGALAIGTFRRLHDQTDIQIWDRAYRLRHNEKQVHVDEWTYGGVAAGGLSGGLLATPRVKAAFYGASLGCGLAFVVGMVNNLPKK